MSAAQATGTPAPPPVADSAALAPLEGGQEASATEQDSAAEAKDPPKLGSPEWMKMMGEAKRRKREAKAAGKPELIGDDAEPESEKAPAKLDDITEEFFKPEALSTPEGVKRAADLLLFGKKEIEDRQWKQDHQARKTRKQAEATAATAARVEKGVEFVQRFQQTFREKHAIITGARMANPMQICATLDELAGGKGDPQAGQELLNAMIIAIGRDGQAPKETANEKALRERYERMENERRSEREQWEAQQAQAQEQQLTNGVQQLEMRVGAVAVNNPGQYPALAELVAAGRITAANIGKYAGDLMEQAANSGTPLDVHAAIGIIEKRLVIPGRAAQAVNGGGQPQAVAKPSNQGKRVAKSTVLPSDADRSLGGTRKESREERHQRLARDPVLAKKLGPAFERALRGE